MAVDDVAATAAKENIPSERSVLVVEDDRSFLQRLAKALESRGFPALSPAAAGTSDRPRRPGRIVRWGYFLSPPLRRHRPRPYPRVHLYLVRRSGILAAGRV